MVCIVAHTTVYPCIPRRLHSGGHRYRHSAIIADATMMAHINVASAPARYVYDCTAYRFSSHHIHLLHIYRTQCLSIGYVASPPLRYSIPICISLVDLFGYMYRYTTPHLIQSHYTPQPEACDKHCNLRRYADGFYQICDHCRDTDPSMHADCVHSASYITPLDIFLTVPSASCSYKLSTPLDIALVLDG